MGKKPTMLELKEAHDSESFEDKKFEQIIQNSYFFGYFMALHMMLKIRDNRGNEAVWKFAEKKYKEIGLGNKSFVIQAEKNDKLTDKYYLDTMEEKLGETES